MLFLSVCRTSTFIPTCPNNGTSCSDRTLLQTCYSTAFAIGMDCVNQLSLLKCDSNFSSLVADCMKNHPINDDCTPTNKTTVPSQPCSQSWTYTEVPVNATGRHRRQLLRAKFAQPTSQPGKTWSVSTVMTYDTVDQAWITSYIASNTAIVNGVVALIQNVLTLSDLKLMQVSDI